MSWQSWERTAEKGPVILAVRVGFALVLVAAAVGLLAWVFGWFADAAKVAKDEFGPKAALRKYEEFKDQAAALESKLATIEVYAKNLSEMEKDKKSWGRLDKEHYYGRQHEVAGLKASYNALAARYNANMAKFNYRFANAGELPPGAKEPLPREFKPYVTE